MIQIFFQLPRFKDFSPLGQMLIGVAFLLAIHVCPGGLAYGQVPPITPSEIGGLGTNVANPVDIGSGFTKIDITGGTRPGGGSNLFHSFGDFNVPENHIANFKNGPTNPATSNILSRVTGGNPSNIFGTIQTEGFGNANLFLMNPAGIVFGPNASLDVSGSAHFTTADYLKLSDGVQFTALPSAQDAVLSIYPVSAFGFLDSSVSPISVEGSTLSVGDGQAISLVGGDISIGSGLNALEGQIGLASVASPGEVIAGTFDTSPNVNGDAFTTMGNISLLEGSILDVSGDAAGSVVIRGGELLMTNAIISADTGDSSGAAVAVDINISGDISIASDTNSAITAIANGAGDSGEVRLTSKNLTAQSSISDFFTALIDTSNFGTGNSGSITLNVESGNLTADGGPFSGVFIESGSGGDGNGGNVTIKAGNAEFTFTAISTGDFNLFGFGSGGHFSIEADSLTMDTVSIATDSFNSRGGDLTFNAHDITFSGNSSIGVLSLFGESVITINANHFVMDGSNLLNQTALAAGGGVTLNADSVELKNFSQIASQTFGDGDSGAIHVMATEHITISDDPTLAFAPGGIFTNSFGDPDLGMNGKAGAIELTTPLFTMSGGARLNSTTESSGRGGDISINAQNVLISGQRIPEVGSDTFGLGSTRASGIYTRTVGSDSAFCSGPCGASGNISIAGGSIELTKGAVLDSGTTSTGGGGNITVNVFENVSIAGTLDDGTPGGLFSRSTGTDPGSGEGGIIALTAGDSFFLKDGATVSASSSGPANAGNIQLTATDTILLDGATVTTEALQASGGNIKLIAQDLIRLNDSTISSSVEGNATTVGGDISLDPKFIILQNSHILAKAFQGQGGNISLIASQAVLVDPFSTLDASSALGISGSVNIQAPTKFLSGAILPLESQPVEVAALYGARCAAGSGGNFSTFVDSKAGSLSPVPGAFLASPLLNRAPSAPVVADRAAGQRAPVILTASIAPLVLGHAEPTTACP